MKGFNIAAAGALAPVDEILASLHHEHGHPPLSALLRASQSSLSDAAAPSRKTGSHKRRWGTLIEAARAARVSRLIGRSRSEDSVCDHSRRSPSGSDHTDSGSDSQTERRRRGERTVERRGPLLALAALKRKRKKFSDSRRAQGEPSRCASDKKVTSSSASVSTGAPACSGGGTVLVRASSVPARSPPPPPDRPAVRCSDTHEEPAAERRAGGAGSTEPLLASLDDEPHKEEECLARLPGVTPLHGHGPQQSAGWL